MIFCLFLLFISLVLFLTFISSSGNLLNNLSYVFWLTSLLYCFVNLYKIFYNGALKSKLIRYKKNIYMFCGRHISKSTVLLFLLALVLLAGFSKTYYLGGDDTRLFYIYPDLFINNLAVNLGTNNSLSSLNNFLPASMFYPFLIILSILKHAFGFINLQSTLYLLNLIFGVYSFYYLFHYLVGEKNSNGFTKIIGIVSSLMYVFSIFNSYVLYSSKLIAIFIVSLLPLGILLIVRGVLEKNIRMIIFCAMIWTCFGLTSISFPWVLASLLSLIPLLIYIFIQHKMIFIKYLVLFLILLFGFNLYWLWDVPNFVIYDKASIVNAVDMNSKDFIEANLAGIVNTASLNRLFYPLFNLFHRQIQINYNWSYLPIYNTWYIKLICVNWIFFAVLITAGIFVLKNKNVKGIYFTCIFSFFLAIYFYTVNFGDLYFGNPGTDLFVWMSEHVWGFVVFRNMYDKFAHAMSLTYALSFGISLHIISKYLKHTKHMIYILIFVSFVVGLNIKSEIMGNFDKLPVWSTSNTFKTIEKLNEDYLNMANYVSTMDDYSKHLSLPLSGGNVTAIVDNKLQNHFYLGVSPFLVMTGKNDFSGGMSFDKDGDYLIKAIKEGKYEIAGRIFQKYNISYININHTLSDELKNSYLYSEGLYYYQNNEFYKEILGDKIQDFGDSYSLYKINEKYHNAKIALIRDIGENPEIIREFKYDRISDSQFDFNLDIRDGDRYMMFLEPFNNNWSLYIDGNKLSNINHKIIYGYANYWEINSIPAGVYSAKLYYEPKRFQNTFNIVSLSLFVGATAFCFGSISKTRKNL